MGMGSPLGSIVFIFWIYPQHGRSRLLPDSTALAFKTVIHQMHCCKYSRQSLPALKFYFIL